MPEALHVKAAFVTELGAPSKIEIGDLTLPPPGATEAVIRVDAVCVNPVDTLVRSGRFATPVPMPLVLGRDLVGQVISAPHFSGFRPGDRVWASTLGYGGRQGSFATEAVVPVERLYPILDGADSRDVVALAHPATTAALAWFEHVQLRVGQRVFIGGAAGNVGRAAVTIAKWAGVEVVASAGARDLESVREAVELAVDYAAPNLADAALAGGPFDVVWDTSGAMEWSDIARLVGAGGKVVVTAAGEPATVPWAQLYTNDVTVIGFVHSRASAEQMARAAAVVNRGAVEGWLRPNITEVVGLDSTRDVHERMEAGRVRGRIVLRIGFSHRQKPAKFRQRTADVGIRTDVSNVAEVLELLEDYDSGQIK